MEGVGTASASVAVHHTPYDSESKDSSFNESKNTHIQYERQA